MATAAAVLVLALVLVSRISGLADRIQERSAHRLQIDDTANVITEIRKISEFTTACYYGETAMVGDKYFRPKEFVDSRIFKFADKFIPDSVSMVKYAYIVRGKVRAGYDLSNMSSEDLSLSGDTLFVRLPDPEILDAIVNPGDIDLFDVHGIVRGLDTMVWSDKDEKQVIRNARRDFMKDALDSGLLEKAESNGIKELEACFKAFGFKFVEFL